MELRTAKAQFAVEFIDIEKAAGIPGVTWEPFQIEYLNNTHRFALDVKSRQIAWSFTSAMDALIDALLNPGVPYIFVSINLDEAREKIRYAKAIADAVDIPGGVEFVRDSTTELELTNGSRLISHPCRPPRGKARARIYLDEMAHYPHDLDRDVYTAALPATTKGDGYVRIGSSTLGARGLFWEIATEAMRKYPGYKRRYLPWWVVNALCTNVVVGITQAPKMATAERVYKFGTTALIEIFENMFLEDFEQEYECAWTDESVSWIPWELILDAQNERLKVWQAYNPSDAVLAAKELKALVDVRKGVEIAFTGGIDVGRKKNLTEMVVLGKGTSDQLPVRMTVSLDRVPFDEQEACFKEIVETLPFTSVMIDQNGIGMQLAENLAKHNSVVEPAEFTNPSKELWAVETRVQFERHNVVLPADRDFAYQIHSIKRKVTSGKRMAFDTERNEKHHADKFWALALAVYAANVPTKAPTAMRVEGLWKSRDRAARTRRRKGELVSQ